ncbi:unnamed protein product [Ixodes pacificus]
MRNMCRHRNSGRSATLLPLLRESDPQYFYHYTRMLPATSDRLLSLEENSIRRRDTNWRECIPARTRLEITVRFLASGDSQRSLSYVFRAARSTMSEVIAETSQAIWDNLKDDYVRCPRTPEEWMYIARGFLQRWTVPNCIGKWLTLEAPCNSGSENFNYKGAFSKILIAMCDSAYKFLYVDVGRCGGESDGGVFRRCDLSGALESQQLGVPEPAMLPGGKVKPYGILRDEAFPLKPYPMRPNPKRFITSDAERIYNYRLSRGRRVIENAFGILTSRWRILRRRFKATDENVNRYVLASVALHNFLMTLNEEKNRYCPPAFVDTESWNGNLIQGEWRKEKGTVPIFSSVSRLGSNKRSKISEQVREYFKDYIMGHGKVEWQLDYIHRNAPRMKPTTPQ